MSADVVNLRRVRKGLARADREAAAAAARARHGRTRGEREAEAIAASRAERRLDNARREPVPPQADGG